MKKYLKQYPAFLLLTFLVYSSVIGPTIASSIVVCALCALSAYRAYSDTKETPDPSIALRKEIETLRKDMSSKHDEFMKIKDDFSKISLSVTRGGFSGQQIRF